MILRLNEQAMKRKVPFLQYARKERNGILLLLGTFMALMIFPEWYFRWFPPELPEVEVVIYEVEPESDAPDEPVAVAERFSFNPNTASEEELRRLGMSARLATSLLRFRERGGKFYRPDDLRKLYLISDTLAEQLIPYVVIPAQQSKQSRKKPAYKSYEQYDQPRKSWPEKQPRKQAVAIDVNSALQADWEQLPGIGPTYAARILRFREALGGFSSIAQIADTWQLPDSVYQKIRPLLLYEQPPNQLLINAADAEELAEHPYIRKWQAEKIAVYRRQYGPFEHEQALRELGVFKEEELNTLLPYLNFKQPADGNGN